MVDKFAKWNAKNHQTSTYKGSQIFPRYLTRFGLKTIIHFNLILSTYDKYIPMYVYKPTKFPVWQTKWCTCTSKYIQSKPMDCYCTWHVQQHKLCFVQDHSDNYWRFNKFDVILMFRNQYKLSCTGMSLQRDVSEMSGCHELYSCFTRCKKHQI